jgi:hypothetical protein
VNTVQFSKTPSPVPPPINRRRFLGLFGLVLTAGIIELVRDARQIQTQITLKSILSKLASNKKQKILDSNEDISTRMSLLLDCLTHESVGKENIFLKQGKEKLAEYTFHENHNDYQQAFFIDFKTKTISLNLNKILKQNNADDDDQKLKTIIALLFATCGLVQLDPQYQNGKNNYAANQVFFSLIMNNVMQGFGYYNFDEVQASSANELEAKVGSLPDIIIALNGKFDINLREQVIARMKSLNIDNRSMGTLNHY